MTKTNSVISDPFYTHQLEVNLGLKKPEDLQKFLTTKGKNSISPAFNRIVHLIRYKVWIGESRILKEVKKYGDFVNPRLENQQNPELEETSRKVQALVSLFAGTKMEKNVSDLMQLDGWKSQFSTNEELKLGNLESTIKEIGLTLNDGDFHDNEEEILFALRTNPKFYKKLSQLQKKLGPDSPESRIIDNLMDKAGIEDQLQYWGVDVACVYHDYESVKFLFESRLIYKILGFQNTTADGPQLHAIEFDSDEGVMIKKEGEWVLVKEIMKTLSVDDFTSIKGLVEKPLPGDPQDKIRQRWNYFSPDGLVPVDPEKHSEMYPVEKLSKQDMVDLLAHAQSFQEAPLDPTQNCVVQIFTSPRDITSHDDNFFLSRFSASQALHTGIRIINSDGTVFSTGLIVPVANQHIFGKIKNSFISVNGAVLILDLEEFNRYESRIVTSIPATGEIFKEIKNKLDGYMQDPLPFNAQDNCAFFATEILDMAGVKIDGRLTIWELATGILPSPKNIVVIGKPIRFVDKQIGKIIKKTPKPILKVARFPKRVVCYVPNVLSKLVVATLGGTRGPIKSNKKKACIIPSAREVFNGQPIKVSYPRPIIQWQLQQQSTAVHMYSGKPSMTILPPKGDKKIQGDARQKVLYKRFVSSF